jgi:hypothetical protein
VAERPSYRELNNKLSAAKDFIAKSQWAPAEPVKLTPDLQHFDLYAAEEQAEAFLAALGEIEPGHYIGTHPPEKAYEKHVYGLDLFAFCWPSKRFECTMYIKFCVTKDALYVVSFHESRGRD